MADQVAGRSDSGEGPREEGQREERGQRQQRRYFPRRRVCAFCVDKVKHVDYKDVHILERYVSDQGKIKGRRQSGNCTKHQHQVSRAIKRARQIALLPYSRQHRFTA